MVWPCGARCRRASVPTNVAHAAGTRLVLGLVELALLPTQHVYDGPGTSWDWVRRLGGVSVPAAKLSLLAYVVAFAGMALALRWMTSASVTPRHALPGPLSVARVPFRHLSSKDTHLNISGEEVQAWCCRCSSSSRLRRTS